MNGTGDSVGFGIFRRHQTQEFPLVTVYNRSVYNHLPQKDALVEGSGRTVSGRQGQTKLRISPEF